MLKTICYKKLHCRSNYVKEPQLHTTTIDVFIFAVLQQHLSLFLLFIR